MEDSNELTQGLNEIKTVANEGSWFRDTPHYWASKSLPFAYALACVEVVCENSEKAGIIYDKIVEAWSDPRTKRVSEKISSIMTEPGKEKLREAVTFPRFIGQP